VYHTQYRACRHQCYIIVLNICDPILENVDACTTFLINHNIKTMGKIQKFNNKIMQVIDCLNSQWINSLINKSWISLCLPAHWKFENLCFILVATQISFGVMTVCSCCSDEGIYGWSFLSKYAFIIRHGNIYGPSIITWWVEKFLANKMSHFNFAHHCISKLWLFVQVPVDFFLNSLHTKLFICSTSYSGLYLRHGSTH